MIAIEAGVPSVANGEPWTSVNPPVVRSIEKTDTVLAPVFATWTNEPDGSTVTQVGCEPVGNGEPGTGVNDPLAASIAKAETALEPALAT